MHRGNSLALIVCFGSVLSFVIPGINLLSPEDSHGQTGLESALRKTNCFEKDPVLETVLLEPERLQFGFATLGEVIVRYIEVRSPSHNSSIRIIKAVPLEPGMFYVLSSEVPKDGLACCKMKIALIPKIIGSIDTVLVISTSVGDVSLPVEGRISPSPFRIPPIEHPRIPSGTNFSTEITLYNSFPTLISVETVYLSGGPFQLLLPDSAHLSNNHQFVPRKKDFWDIPPFESRTVAVLSMETFRSFREQSFIRIKLNSSMSSELLLPIDVRFVEDEGVYAADGVLYFGVIRLRDVPVVLPLRLHMTANSTLPQVKDVIDEYQNIGIRINLLKDYSKESIDATTVAEVIFDASVYNESANVNGNLIVQFENSDSAGEILVPYRAFVSAGDLGPTKGLSWPVPARSEDIGQETLFLRNTFDYPVTVFQIVIVPNVAFSTLKLVDPEYPIVLPPDEDSAVMDVRFIVRSRITHKVQFRLTTSVGEFEVPVTLYTGNLTVDLSAMQTIIREGIIIGQQSQGTVWFRNHNPVTVHVKDIRLTNICLDIARSAAVTAAGSQIESGNAPVYAIKPGGALQVDLRSKDMPMEVTCRGELTIKTDFQNLTIKIETVVAGGRLEIYAPERPLIVEGIFPSGIVQRNLTVFNTFDKTLEIQRIFSDEFPRLSLYPSLSGIEITEKMGLSFDTLTYDARNLCQELPGLCYAGFDLSTSSEKSESWKRPLRVISSSSVDIDRRMRDRQRALWDTLAGGNESFDGSASQRYFEVRVDWEKGLLVSERLTKKRIETSLKITTTQFYSFDLPVTLRFAWPPPMFPKASESLEFPLLSIGNVTEYGIEVTNPSEVPLFVHAYVFKDDKASTWNRDIFSVKSIVPKGTSAGYSAVDEERLPENVRLPGPPKGTSASVVPPGGVFFVKLTFQPQAEACYTALLYLRNNLTVIETLPVRGCGVEPKLEIASGDSLPSNSSHVLIKFTASDASYCRNRAPESADRKEIRKTGKMVISNPTGAHVTVDRIVVEEEDWYHRSFVIPDISPFVIAPKKSKKLLVEFNPDFGMLTKSGKISVFIRDKLEPFVFAVTGETEEKATKLCRSVFGRSENDIWIRYVLFIRRWSWTFYFLPVIVVACYLSFVRKWYAKRLKSQFNQRFHVFKEERKKQETAKSNYGNRSRPGGELASSDGSRFHHGSRRQARGNQVYVEQRTVESTTTEENLSLRQLIEKEIPEDLWELCSVAYYATSPFTFVMHFRFPKRPLFRAFVIVEAVIWPLRIVLALLGKVTEWMCSAFGYKLTNTRRPHHDIPMFSSKATNAKLADAVDRTGFDVFRRWYVSVRERFAEAFKSEPAVVVENEVVVESGKDDSGRDSFEVENLPANVMEELKRIDAVKSSRSLSSTRSDYSQKESQPSLSSESFGSSQRTPSNNQEICLPSRLGVDPPSPATSRDSSLCQDMSKGLDSQSIGDFESQNSRKQRRKQIQQAKREADKTAKLAKLHNKTLRKVEERKLLEAKTEEILAQENPKNAEDTSETDTEKERHLAAKKRAKEKAEKEAARIARQKFAEAARSNTPAAEWPTLSVSASTVRTTPVASKPDPPPVPAPVPHREPIMRKELPPGLNLQNRPMTYPAQCDVLQKAFFRVEPKENGLMFTEMDRDQCLQLVKQLKRDNQDLFMVDPKAAVDLLLKSTRSSQYRIDGELVHLVQKSAVMAFTKRRHDHHNTTRHQDESAAQAKQSLSPVSTQRGSPPPAWLSYGDSNPHQAAPVNHLFEQHRSTVLSRSSGSLSPTESTNRLSPINPMSYADVASARQSLSRKSSASAESSSTRNVCTQAPGSPGVISMPNSPPVVASTVREKPTSSRFFPGRKASDDRLDTEEKGGEKVDKGVGVDFVSKLVDWDDQLEKKFGKGDGNKTLFTESDLSEIMVRSRLDSDSPHSSCSSPPFSHSPLTDSYWPEEPVVSKEAKSVSTSVWRDDFIGWPQSSLSATPWSPLSADKLSAPWTTPATDTTLEDLESQTESFLGPDFWQPYWHGSSFFTSKDDDTSKKPIVKEATISSEAKFGVIGDKKEAAPWGNGKST